MVLGSIAGWAGVGFLTRCYQLGIQKRHVFDNFGGHVGFMAGFGALGYYFHGLTQRQEILLKDKQDEILANRQKVQERLEARKAAEETSHE
ncbi:unnamed protein product [Sympodiomycopsis kandeliae]